jgi:predicted 2-oxoglutarate/Fe(II)-dependent dioxygenase YbiX
MPRAGFLALLGWFVAPRFLDAAACARMRREMQAARIESARILDGENALSVDAGLRRTEIAMVSDETRALVAARLMATKAALGGHFGFDLSDFEPPSFLIYKPGFYYGRHVDANPSPDAPDRFQRRRVSISIFLNGEGEEGVPDTYTGGSLAFPGSPRSDPNANPGLTLTGEEGLLIGFRSDWPHEVQAVTRGTRYSIVTWFA